jgi:hypothetical protein
MAEDVVSQRQAAKGKDHRPPDRQGWREMITAQCVGAWLIPNVATLDSFCQREVAKNVLYSRQIIT